MNIDNNIQKDLNTFEHIAKSDVVIDQKLEEIINLLSTSDIDSKKAREYRLRFNQAVEKSLTYSKKLKAFKKLDNKSSVTPRGELLDELTVLLASHDLNSRMSSSYIKNERFKKAVLITIGIILIVMGFAMIVMPAPPYFEMFTIFYFNHDDGVTLMDLISLLIVFSGIYLFIRAVTKPLSVKN